MADRVAVFTKNDGDLQKWLQTTVQEYIVETATEEARTQIQLGNMPSHMLVDGRGRKLNRADIQRLRSGNNVVDPSRVKREVRVQFGTVTDLYEAVEYAYGYVSAVMRRATSEGFRSIYFWCSLGKDKGGVKLTTLGGVKAWLDRQSDTTGTMFVRLMGPTTIYRRFLIYSPKGKQSFVMVRGDRAEGRLRYQKDGKYKINVSARGRVSARVAQALYHVAAQRVRRRFPGVYAADSFVRSKEPLPVPSGKKKYTKNKHIPTLYIGISPRRK